MLEPVARAVTGAATQLQNLESSDAPDLAKTIARKLVDSLSDKPRPTPAELPASVQTLALGDAQPESAEVGWLKPASNRVPINQYVPSPLLDSGKLYATGLYAHAPSHYIFNLGGKWKELTGQAGLHTLHQPYGTVVFIIRADGRQLFRSPVIRGASKATYKLDIRGVRQLELVVDPTEDGNHNDWALWLDPVLSR